MNSWSLSNRILLGRFLTRAGDQAWDFAVPLVILNVLPGQLKIAAVYYLLVRLAHTLLLPRFSASIDRISRPLAVRIGLLTQMVGIAVGTCSILMMSQTFIVPFMGLVVAGVLANLGSVFMDIVVANDLVPTGIPRDDLTNFNSRLRQVDLATEVSVPVVTGLVLLISSPAIPLFGFLLIAIWNICSFVPEYVLLSSIFKTHPELAQQKITVLSSTKIPLVHKLTAGWRLFFSQPIALAVVAYALLWLSVLSPHGVLLTAFLKDGWSLPEWIIGAFRGMGAAFGLLATFTFARVSSRYGLLKATRTFVLFQMTMVLFGLVCFFGGGTSAHVGFLICILFSRIGLYGFSIGETQIRQMGIREDQRGRVNGMANALTSLATLALYGAATLLPSTEHFYLLVIGSTLSVTVAAAVFAFWVNQHGKPIEDPRHRIQKA